MQITLQKNIKHLFLATALVFLAGCQYLEFPGVYKIQIQQGNIITQDMIDQLQPGMSKRQVRYVMGNPLIQDTFNPDRWDYLYTLTDAADNLTKERVSIYFADDKLTSFNGDYRPTSVSTAESTKP
jgi:outer membrane protein assembly factor BamE